MEPKNESGTGDQAKSPVDLDELTLSEKCPFCSGLVRPKAVRCKHCGETLDVVLRAAEEAKRLAQICSQGLPAIPLVPETIPGYVYIMINPAMPNMLKIGMTTKQPAERAQELSQGTGVPTIFHVAYSVEVRDCRKGETLVHSRFEQYRVNKGREFFNVPLDMAIRELNRLAMEMGEVASAQTSQIPKALPVAYASPVMSDARDRDPTYKPTRGSMLSILAKVRRLFQGFPHTFIHPDVSMELKRKAQERYSAYMQEGEEILLLYDGSWHGTGDNGFILTDRGIGWAAETCTPNYVTYCEVKQEEIYSGWGGFYMQGDRKADVWSADSPKVAEAIKQLINALWRHRA